MATSHIVYTGNLRTLNTHLESGTQISTDAPKDNKGLGEAFSPTDLVATALGACMISIMGISAREHNWNIENSTVDITKIMGTEPRRIIEIKADLLIQGELTDKDKAILERVARHCPVAKSIHPDIKQTINFRYAQ